MNKITLTVGQVRGTVLASAKKDARYYLNGSLFDFDKGLAVSTDDKALLAINVEFEGSGQVIIPRDSLEAISKGGTVTDTVTVEYDDTLTLIRSNGLQLVCQPVDNTFPDYKRVIPTKTSGEAAHYDPELVSRISKALRLAIPLLSKDKIPVVGNNRDSGAIMFFHGYSNVAIAVVMPFRAEGSADAEMIDFWTKGEL